MKKYSVGVPVRNEENTLEDCIGSILSQTLLPENIYICLNGSNSQTIEVANTISDKNQKVKLIESSPGKANAWNKIVGTSENNQILFTDGDSYLEKYCAEKMIESLNSNPNCCVTGGDVFYMQPPESSFLALLLKNKFDRVYEIKNLCGNNYMIKREELLKTSEEMRINLLESDIINEDALIGAIARSEGKFVKSNTFAKVFPASNIPDYITLTMRIKKGYLQLEERYPELFYAGQTKGVENNKVQGGKTYLVIRAITNLICDGVMKIDSQNQNIQWKETKSTKLKLPKTYS